MSRTLLIIDIQNDYFDGGAMPLAGAAAAARSAAKVLESFRASGDPVVHVQHVWDDPDATFMRPLTQGVQINSAVAPLPEEPIVTKEQPNAFHDTGLNLLLKRLGTEQLIVMGMMTSMCVDSTVRRAHEVGFDVQLVHDACAAPSLTFEGVTVDGSTVHAAFVAALGDGFADIVSSRDFANGGGGVEISS